MQKPEVFQLMPPRGGNRKLGENWPQMIHVSTHAPARGQSGVDVNHRLTVGVSTHAPARGQS